MKNQRQILTAVFLFAVTILAYWPAIVDGGYIWDDDHYLTENGLLSQPDGLRKIWFRPRESPQYYPMVFTTFRIEHDINVMTRGEKEGRHPFIFHLDNVLIHALSALLLWRILLRLKVPGALLAASLFALHPVHVESVAWVTERKNVLSGLFYLVSLRAYLLWYDLETGKTGQIRHYVISLLTFVLALFSKTVTATLGPVILVLVWWKRGRFGLKDLAWVAPHFALGLLGAAMTTWTEIDHVEAKGPEWDLSIGERAIVAGRATVFYIQKLLWPDPLVFSYERWAINGASFLQWLFPIAVLGTMAALVLLAWRKIIPRGPAAAFMFFVGSLTPALGFINVYPFRYSYVADHFQYLASIGILAMIAGFAARLLPKKVLIGVAAVVLASLSVLTWRQCRIYENEETLWMDTKAKNPDSWMSYNNLGMLYFREGDRVKAEGFIRKAAELNPNAREVLNNVGLYEAAAGNHEAAIEWFDRALANDPRHTASLANKALSLMFMANGDKGELEKALALVQRALDIAFDRNMDYAHGRFVRGQILARLERWPEALPNIDAYLKTQKGWANPLAHTERGKIVAKLGRTEEAVVCFKRAIECDRRFYAAYVELAATYQKLKRYSDAARAAAAAISIAAPRDADKVGRSACIMALSAALNVQPEECGALLVDLARLAGPNHAVKLIPFVLENVQRKGRSAHVENALRALRAAPELKQNANLQSALDAFGPRR